MEDQKECQETLQPAVFVPHLECLAQWHQEGYKLDYCRKYCGTPIFINVVGDGVIDNWQWDMSKKFSDVCFTTLGSFASIAGPAHCAYLLARCLTYRYFFCVCSPLPSTRRWCIGHISPGSLDPTQMGVFKPYANGCRCGRSASKVTEARRDQPSVADVQDSSD